MGIALLVRRRETQAANENKSKWNLAIMQYGHIPFKGHLCIWLFLSQNIYFKFHTLTEDPSLPFRSDWSIASQNLKFTGQMSDDWCLFAGLISSLSWLA